MSFTPFGGRAFLVLFASAIVVCDSESLGSSKREIRRDFLSESEKDPLDGAMWFGPRLGRKKRSDGEEEEEESAEREKTDKTLVGFLQDAPWAFVALKGIKFF